MKTLTKILIVIGVFLAPILVFALAHNLTTLTNPAVVAKKYADSGNKYFIQQNYLQAAKDFSKAIKKFPRSPYLYHMRGCSYAGSGNHALAAVDFLKAVRLDPSGSIGEKAKEALKRIRDSLKSAVKTHRQKRATASIKNWETFFDEGLAYVGKQDYSGARAADLKALSAAVAAKKDDPSNKNYSSAIHLTKGYMYFISGSNYIRSVKADFDNYSLLVALRRAYYPLKCAEFYYKAAMQASTIPALKNLIEDAIKKNRYFLDNSSDKWLASIDTKGSVFMKNIENEAQVIVNFDIINDLLATKDFKAAADFIDKNAKLINGMNPEENLNAPGFVSMHNAYLKLYRALVLIADDPVKNKNTVQNELNACIADLHNAQANFTNTSLSAAAQDLENIMETIRNAA
ncbi:MAG: hypothetical protein PHI58_01330 [Candidatus Omnitrophica bacterium]|nr:hypothetical protein [Candidatus Omnitrophota bacterium]